MFSNIEERKVLFLDIETVSLSKNFSDLNEGMQYHWKRKCKNLISPEEVEARGEEVYEDLFSARAGIHAEFGKIVCISVGLLGKNSEGIQKAKLKSFAGDDESILLNGFIEILEKYFNNPNVHFLFGHNIREFDIPYLCRRMIINGLNIPPMLDLAGKKPWETKHLIDTMEFWKFGDYKSFTSLDLLANVLGIESSKSDIDGSQVSSVYWNEGDVNRIASYCERDVLVLIQLFLRLQNRPQVAVENIEFGTNTNKD